MGIIDNTSYVKNPLPYNKSLLLAFWNLCVALKLPYVWDGKEPKLGSFPPTISGYDCSGFTEAAAYFASGGKIQLPQGSSLQLEYAQQNGWQESSFDQCGNLDQVLRQCIYEEPGHTGHTWFTFMGYTMESHGGVGCFPRAWDNPILASLAPNTKVFALA